MSNNDTMYVRLKPYDVKRGYLVRRYMLAGHEFMTDNETGRPIWNRVTAQAAAFLKPLKQNPDDPESKDLFDVLTPEEYATVREREQAQAMTAVLGLGEGPVREPKAPPTIDRVGGRTSAIPDLGPMVSVGTGVQVPGDRGTGGEEPKTGSLADAKAALGPVTPDEGADDASSEPEAQSVSSTSRRAGRVSRSEDASP